MSANSRDAANVLGHAPEAVIFDGETWKIVCACAWKCWNVEDEEVAWDAFDDHIFDHVKTILTRQRQAARVVTL